MKTFEELGLADNILQAIREMGYENPMPVQEEAIPYLLEENNDVVALAQTGTGKTAAYGLPLLQKTDVDLLCPQSLILCPTRELCLQITSDLNDYAKYIEGLKVQPVYGGSSIESQIKALKRGVHIVVATPGRLLDLMNRKVVSLQDVHKVVLDEADEMLSMGFSEDLNAILAEVPEQRCVMLFSATMSNEIARISKQYLHDAKEIVIGTKNEGAKNVSHIAYVVHAKDKYLALKRIVDYYPKIYGIVFCRTRMETQEIADKLIQDGYNADALHGELSQQQRDLTMQKFRQHRIQLLVATDVAARGIDVDDLTHVINYGFPDDVEVYTHRSGRTGRVDKKGISIAIIHIKEKGKLKLIEKSINKQFEIGTIPSGEEICEKQLYKAIDDIERVEVSEEEIEKFLPAVYRKLEWLSKEDLIKRMLSLEFNRFAAYYANAPEIEIPAERSTGKKKEKGSHAKGPRAAEAGFSRIFINLGKMDGIAPNKLIDLLNKRIKRRVEVGRIDLMTKFSFFEVPEDDAEYVIERMQGSEFHGRNISLELADQDNQTEHAPIHVHEGKSNSKENRKNGRAYLGDGNRMERRSERKAMFQQQTEKKQKKDEKKGMPPKFPKRKASIIQDFDENDWRRFFQTDNQLRGEMPDFEEDGWQKVKKSPAKTGQKHAKKKK